MRKTIISKSILTSFFLLLILPPVHIVASDETASLMINNNAYMFNTIPGAMYVAAADESSVNEPIDKPSESKNNSRINWHKILGWSTLGMMGVTITTGFVIPEKGHCALAWVTTGFAVATCGDGIYEYGGLISFTDGDWKYNTHAILGTLATAGFITTLALADGTGHVATGIASGVAFTVALAIIYF